MTLQEFEIIFLLLQNQNPHSVWSSSRIDREIN